MSGPPRLPSCSTYATPCHAAGETGPSRRVSIGLQGISGSACWGERRASAPGTVVPVTGRGRDPWRNVGDRTRGGVQPWTSG